MSIGQSCIDGYLQSKTVARVVASCKSGREGGKAIAKFGWGEEEEAARVNSFTGRSNTDACLHSRLLPASFYL